MRGVQFRAAGRFASPHRAASEAAAKESPAAKRVVSKNTNELKTRAPGRFGLDVSTLGSPMEARILPFACYSLSLISRDAVVSAV